MSHDTRPIMIWSGPQCLFHLSRNGRARRGQHMLEDLDAPPRAPVCPPPRSPSPLSVGSLAWPDWSDPLQPRSGVILRNSTKPFSYSAAIQCHRRYRQNQRHARCSKAGQAVILVRPPFLEMRTRRRDARTKFKGKNIASTVETRSEFNFQPCGKMGMFVELVA